VFKLTRFFFLSACSGARVLGVYDRAQECIGKALDINPRYMPAQKLKCELERVQKWLFKSQHQDWKPNDSAY